MRIGWVVCLLLAAPAGAQETEGLEGIPLPGDGGLILPTHSTDPADNQPTVLPEDEAYSARLAKALGLAEVDVRRSPFTAGDLELLEGRSGGGDGEIGHLVKVELEGLSLISARLSTRGANGHAFRYAQALLAKRHQAWGALSADPLPQHANTWGGELVALREREVLMAWGPALLDLDLLSRTMEQGFTARASKNPYIARGVFHRDYAAVFVAKPHGEVYAEMQRRLERAGEQQEPAEEWVQEGSHLRFGYPSGYCGEVRSDGRSGSYWVARQAEHQALAEGTFALLADSSPTRGGGMDDALQSQ